MLLKSRNCIRPTITSILSVAGYKVPIPSYNFFLVIKSHVRQFSKNGVGVWNMAIS